jgi:mannose-6-phosphate isomerase-like protein (cupin superfamily)
VALSSWEGKIDRERGYIPMPEEPRRKNLDSPDETRTFDQGMAQIVSLGDFKVSRHTLQPGWKWSEHVKPIAKTDSCQVKHTGYVVSGRLKVVMDDGFQEVFGPGDAYVIPSGHDGWVVSDTPCVVVDVSTETAEKFAKEEAPGLIDKAKDKLSRG